MAGAGFGDSQQVFPMLIDRPKQFAAERVHVKDEATAGEAGAAPAAEPGAGTPHGATGNRELARRLSRASVWALAVYVGGAGLTSIAQLEIARLVGVSSYGTYSYVLAWITFLAYAATLGFHVTLLRFVPTYGVKEAWPLARGVINFSLGWSLAASVVAGAVGALVVMASYDRLEPELRTSMMIGMATIPLMTMCLIGAALIRAFGGVVSALLPERIVRDGLLLALVGGAAALTLPMNAKLVMAALLISSILTILLVIVTVRRLWLPSLQGVRPAYASPDWWRAVLPIMIMSAVDILMNRIGVMLLGWTGNVREAGIFSVGFSIAMLMVLPRVAVGTMFAPTVADLHTRGDRAGLQKLFSRASVLSLLGAAVLGLPLIVVMEPLLGWFGRDFTSGAMLASILVVGQVSAAAFGPQLHLLTMTGYERPAAVIMVACAALTVAGCAVGIALGGATGAAIATTVATVIWNIAMAVWIQKNLGLSPGLYSALTGR
jgi:O-antigen/teichoic acid export membrane protein